MIDEAKLHALIGQMLGDLGGASSVAMVRIGDRLGLYRALHDGGGATCEALARRVKLDERYLRVRLPRLRTEDGDVLAVA